MSTPNDIPTLNELTARCEDGARIFEQARGIADTAKLRLLCAQASEKHAAAANDLAQQVMKRGERVRNAAKHSLTFERLKADLEQGALRGEPRALLQALARFEACCLGRFEQAVDGKISTPVRRAIAFECERLRHVQRQIEYIERNGCPTHGSHRPLTSGVPDTSPDEMSH